MAKKTLLYFCSNQSHALREARLSRCIYFFPSAAVTLLLWGLDFISVHQQPSRACNAEGIVSAQESLKSVSAQQKVKACCYKFGVSF